MAVEIKSNERQGSTITSPSRPNLSSVLGAAVTVEGFEATDLGELLREIAEKFNDTDGVVQGQSFLTRYRLRRDN